jgi:hypothetical protein
MLQNDAASGAVSGSETKPQWTKQGRLLGDCRESLANSATGHRRENLAAMEIREIRLEIQALPAHLAMAANFFEAETAIVPKGLPLGIARNQRPLLISVECIKFFSVNVFLEERGKGASECQCPPCEI